MLEKQDSNKVGLYMARELADGTVPDGSTFLTREPNSFEKFGGDYKTVKRNPFNPSRQNAKGTTSDLDTAGGWNEDVTQNNLFDLMEGFFFAAIRRKAVTATNDDTAADNKYHVVASAAIPAGSLILASGFTNPNNNGMKHVTVSAANVLTVSEVTAVEVEAAGQSVAKIGNKFAAGDCVMTVTGPYMVLTFTAFAPVGLGVTPGEWCFIGGDLAITQFATVKPGYARVHLVDNVAKKVYFDKFTSVAGAGDAGAAKTIEIYTGFFIKNEEDEDLIVKSTFLAERPLGKDDDGTQSDNLQHFVLNQMKWNSPLSNKPTIDVTGIGLGYDTRTGAEGLISKSGTNVIVKALGEEAFNTSLNVYRIRLSVIDPANLAPTPLFARVTEWSVTINNNVTAAKAQGSLGGFDTTVGQFDVAAAMTAYFNTVNAVTTIKDNTDCTFDAIYAKHNAGIILDLPLVSTGGGELTIAQNQPIMMPLTNDAAESPFGHTMLLQWFPYLPSVAMAKGG